MCGRPTFPVNKSNIVHTGLAGYRKGDREVATPLSAALATRGPSDSPVKPYNIKSLPDSSKICVRFLPEWNTISTVLTAGCVRGLVCWNSGGRGPSDPRNTRWPGSDSVLDGHR